MQHIPNTPPSPAAGLGTIIWIIGRNFPSQGRVPHLDHISVLPHTHFSTLHEAGAMLNGTHKKITRESLIPDTDPLTQDTSVSVFPKQAGTNHPEQNMPSSTATFYSQNTMLKDCCKLSYYCSKAFHVLAVSRGQQFLELHHQSKLPVLPPEVHMPHTYLLEHPLAGSHSELW